MGASRRFSAAANYRPSGRLPLAIFARGVARRSRTNRRSDPAIHTIVVEPGRAAHQENSGAYPGSITTDEQYPRIPSETDGGRGLRVVSTYAIPVYGLHLPAAAR